MFEDKELEGFEMDFDKYKDQIDLFQEEFVNKNFYNQLFTLPLKCN